MRVLFASDYAHIPENTGGLEINTHELCLALRDTGHQVAVLATLVGRGTTGLIAKVKLRSGLVAGWATDRHLGYPVMRSYRPAESLAAVMDAFRPDVVVVQSWRFGMAREAIRRGVGTVLYTHNANSAIEEVGNPQMLTRCVLLANSAFNAQFHGGAMNAGFDVLFPLVNPMRYRCNGPRTHIVQVGLSTRKGAPITLAIARRRPDVPFIIVKNWEGLQRQPGDETLDADAASLPNVHVIRPHRDARKLYRLTKILLAPSMWEETWGRVVTEAQINAIPVVASRRGGLPEAVGSGGSIIDPEASIDLWVDAVSRLWDDPRWYREMSDRALRRSQHDDLAPEPLVQRFIHVLKTAIGRVDVPAVT